MATPAEGAYDFALTYRGNGDGRLHFDLELRQRPGKCLACHLTHGLPQVLARHPVIDLQGLSAGLTELLAGRARPGGWEVGRTREVSPELHIIPLNLELLD